jgi:hypothetical protein
MGFTNQIVDDSNNRRRRRQERGIDVPPIVTGPSSVVTSSVTGIWTGQDLEMQPLHRLCTLATSLEGTSICAPIVVFQRYIASVSADNTSLKLYELNASWVHQTPLTQVLPKWKCLIGDTAAQPEAMRVVAIACADVRSAERLGYVVLATCEGDVYIVQVSGETEPRVAYSFSTHILNVVSITCWVEDDGLSVGVGAKSGLIEEWKIGTDWKHELRVWKGSFKTPLHSLVAVPMGKEAHTLSACISQRPRMGRALQSSTVEVLDRSKIVADWKDDALLSLVDYCQWPDAGREWRRRSDDIGEGVTFGTNVLCRVGDSAWGAALADGSVGVLTSFRSDQERGGWGLMPNVRQATLSHPAIGMGALNLPNGPHVACCLRGGTVYCLSTDYDEEDESSIPVFLPPFENEEDDFEFTHGFAAGNIQMQGTNVSYGTVHTKNMPIVVYSGDGGVMEVFACGLLSSLNPEVEKQVAMQEMLENGTVEQLVIGLRRMEDDDKLLVDMLWLKAREECREPGITVDLVMTNENDQYENTHLLLLSLAAY